MTLQNWLADFCRASTEVLVLLDCFLFLLLLTGNPNFPAYIPNPNTYGPYIFDLLGIAGASSNKTLALLISPLSSREFQYRTGIARLNSKSSRSSSRQQMPPS
jgi:hypothetical protein